MVEEREREWMSRVSRNGGWIFALIVSVLSQSDRQLLALYVVQSYMYMWSSAIYISVVGSSTMECPLKCISSMYCPT